MKNIELKSKKIDYSKWGYIFIAPFFIIFIVFSLIPLISTLYYSFFEMYRDGLAQVGPNFVGFDNYSKVMGADIGKFFYNTIIIWLIGFIPQMFFALLLASWFTNIQLKIKAQRFFKTVIYMPNLIMATAFSMLFFTLFSDSGPINNILMSFGMETPFRFLSSTSATRGLIGLMNFLMWYGNTTILLMAAIFGIDTSIYEAASIDGASASRVFRKITLPLIKPVLLYVIITSLIGGLQMFDVPQILTNGNGSPNRTSMTIVMYLNKHLYSKNYGMSGAVSVILFIVSGILSIVAFKAILGNNFRSEKK